MSADDELERIKREMMEKLMSPQQPKPGVLRDGEVNELTDHTFQTALGETDKPILVDFWAEWCAPCRMMTPVVHQLAGEYRGKAYVAKVNVDRNQRTAATYGVMSIPNFILFNGGRPVGQQVGAVGKPGLVQLLGRGLA